jgi:hypothetical protein
MTGRTTEREDYLRTKIAPMSFSRRARLYL